MPKQSTQRTILPLPASPPSTDGSEFEPNLAPAPAKRGRKPGPLSRAARETQRKLNHSIIEKARRTKINDALTSLKQLVPAGYGQPSSQPADEDEEGKKKKGKKEDKEKEFKLEILERTVVFLQDLLKRVEVREANVSVGNSSLCVNCSSLLSPYSTSSTTHPKVLPPHPKDPESGPKRKRSLSSNSEELSPKRPCLPSISSWLPDPDSVPAPTSVSVRHIDIDPQLLNTSSQSCATSEASGLPSPPASTHFAPQKHPFLSSSVPALHLGASASASSTQGPSHSPSLSRALGSGKPLYSPPSESYRTPLLSPLRTPEEESAASLLLQISARGDGQAMSRACQVSRVKSGNDNGNGHAIVNVHAQTPGRMLGLDWNKEDSRF